MASYLAIVKYDYIIVVHILAKYTNNVCYAIRFKLRYNIISV